MCLTRCTRSSRVGLNGESGRCPGGSQTKGTGISAHLRYEVLDRGGHNQPGRRLSPRCLQASGVVFRGTEIDKNGVLLRIGCCRASVSREFDIIDCSHTPYFPCLGAQLCSTVKGPSLVVTWHEVWGDYWYEYLGRKGVFGRLIERVVSRLGDTVIAVSQSTRSDLRSIGVKREVEIVPNGVDLEEAELSSSAAVPSDVIFAGRLVDIKNVDLLDQISFLESGVLEMTCLAWWSETDLRDRGWRR